MNIIYIRHPPSHSPTPSVDLSLPSPVGHHYLPRSSGSPNLAHSATVHHHHDIHQDLIDGLLESDRDPEANHERHIGELSVFGDFCLMCGQMIDGETSQGSAYCSEECEYHQLILSSDADWCDLSSEGYQLPSFGTSTAVSSAKSSPLNSPHLPSSDRLAILSSGPPYESLLPLDLGEKLLGAKAVAQQYLDHRSKSIEDDVEENEGGSADRGLSSSIIPLPTRSDLEPSIDCSSNLTTTTTATRHDFNPAVVPPTIRPHLKSRPALAQLTDLDQLSGLSELLAPDRQSPGRGRPTLQRSSSTIHPMDPRLSSNSVPAQRSTHDQSMVTTKANRRVSDPVYRRIDRSLPDPISKPAFHSSFTLTSLSSLSPSALDCSSHYDSRFS